MAHDLELLGSSHQVRRLFGHVWALVLTDHCVQVVDLSVFDMFSYTAFTECGVCLRKRRDMVSDSNHVNGDQT